MNEPLICVHCHRPVVVNRESYEVFEKMHWLCFHLTFEHEGDPDAPGNDPTCPWWTIEVYENHLKHKGEDTQRIMGNAIKERYNL